MNEIDLLKRIAATLKQTVGPATDEPVAKSQAFMASVILEKLAKQWDLQQTHQAATAEEFRALAAALEGELSDNDPQALQQSVRAFGKNLQKADLSAVVAALYQVRAEMEPEKFNRLLSRVRDNLREDLDRRMQVAG